MHRWGSIQTGQRLAGCLPKYHSCVGERYNNIGQAWVSISCLPYADHKTDKPTNRVRATSLAPNALRIPAMAILSQRQPKSLGGAFRQARPIGGSARTSPARGIQHSHTNGPVFSSKWRKHTRTTRNGNRPVKKPEARTIHKFRWLFHRTDKLNL